MTTYTCPYCEGCIGVKKKIYRIYHKLLEVI
jgi:hypothetical protein